jgi:23S rRNA pseudouridine1911/1915/1917 synthase
LGSRSRAVEALDRGRIFLNGVEAGRRDAGVMLRAGDVVGVWQNRPGSASRRAASRAGALKIIYEDAALLVVDKPAGLLTVPLGRRPDAPSAFALLARHFDPKGRRVPLVVHRIDRDTSGLVVFAKNARVQQTIKAQFERREPTRVYIAIVQGRPSPSQGTWRDRLSWDRAALMQTRGGPGDPRATEAVSHYRIIEPLQGAALVEVRLETGKRNQIRVQAALRGIPLVGETQYADTASIPFSRQALHAHRLGFRHPIDERPLEFSSPLPSDMRTLLKRLRRPAP